MTRTKGRGGAPHRWTLGLVLLAAACGGERALSPNRGDAGPSGAAGTTPAGSAGSSGAAGAAEPAGASGSAGTAGAVGSAGSFGIAGAPAPSPLRISAREALSRIAAVLWKQAPDEDLVQQALQSATTTRDLQPFVRQLLGDRRSTLGIGAFYRWWLDLDTVAKLQKDPKLFPEYTPQLQADMVAETETFAVEGTLDRNGTFQNLMTAPVSFLNERLATLYGVEGVTGDAFRAVQLPGSERAGLLTQPSLQVLGSFSYRNSPSLRGHRVLQTFFCRVVPVAPPLPALDPIPSGTTLRQLVETRFSAPTCQACHAATDPVGLAFEHLDPIGRVRATDNGLPIDTSDLGIITTLGPTHAAPVLVNGAVDLAVAVALAPDAENCIAQKWLEFALGRDVENADQAPLREIQRQFAAAKFNLQELIVATLTSDSFLAATEP